MATQAILVEDYSPMIQYAPEGAWQDAQKTDSLASSYSGGSYRATSTEGATATFQFRGTGFSITGGRRPGYGPFSLTIDGQQLFNGSPAPGPSPVNNTLASVTGLPNDVHTVVVTNTGASLIDIDTISFHPQVGSAGSTPSFTTYDDSDPRINYLPSPSVWGLNPRPEFQGNTLHYSQAPDAAASLQFTGNAVGIYGTISPDHTDLSISIDDKTVTMPNGSGSNVPEVRTQASVLLYWADGLDDGQHTVTVSKARNDATKPYIDIDSFVVYSAAQSSTIANNPSSGSPSGTGPPANASIASKHDSLSRTGIIVGASVAGAVALILVLAGILFWLKRRRRRTESTFTKESISPVTPILPMQGMTEAQGKLVSAGSENPAFPFPPLASVKSKPKRSSRLSIAPSYYGDSEFSSSSTMHDRYPRLASSESSEPLVPGVPRLAMPRMPPSARTVPAMVVTDMDSSRPLRPQRPPTLNIGSLQ